MKISRVLKRRMCQRPKVGVYQNPVEIGLDFPDSS